MGYSLETADGLPSKSLEVASTDRCSVPADAFLVVPTRCAPAASIRWIVTYNTTPSPPRVESRSDGVVAHKVIGVGSSGETGTVAKKGLPSGKEAKASSVPSILHKRRIPSCPNGSGAPLRVFAKSCESFCHWAIRANRFLCASAAVSFSTGAIASPSCSDSQAPQRNPNACVLSAFSGGKISNWPPVVTKRESSSNGFPVGRFSCHTIIATVFRSIDSNCSRLASSTSHSTACCGAILAHNSMD